jgi:hypothetical protein
MKKRKNGYTINKHCRSLYKLSVIFSSTRNCAGGCLKTN